MSSEKQSAFLKILKATATLPAQVMFYGAALAAISLIPGAQLPPALAVLAGGVGVNTLSSILERIARGELTEENIRREVQAAIEASGIATALQVRDAQVMIAKLFQQLDVTNYAIQQNEFVVLQRLSELGQYEAFACELQSELAAISAKIDNLATREQVEAILQRLEEARIPTVSAPRLPEPEWVRTYLERLAAQPPRTLDEAQLYIDRDVAREEREIFYSRAVAQYYPRQYDVETRASAKPKAEPLEEVLAREKKLVLLGEPGMGKTTSLQHLAWDAAQRALETWMVSETFQAPEIPIYAELKYYNGEDWTLFLVRQINKQMGMGREIALDPAESARKLTAWFVQPTVRFLFLLDGLNEVRPEFQQGIRGALEALLNSAHSVLISCRERDYDASLQALAAAYVLQGLSEDDICDYLQRVFGEKGEELFERQIRKDKKMRTLAANPLMLWSMVQVAREESEVCLPANRGILFQMFTRAMPRLRRREIPTASVPFDVVEKALAKLAFEMQEREGRLTVDLGEVREWHIPLAGYSLEDVLAQAKEWRFLKSDGRFGDPIEFLHQLFQEYFAAVYLNSAIHHLPLAIALGDRPFRDEWYEIIVMLAGICAEPAELVKWLGKQVMAQKQGATAFLIQQCWETSNAVKDMEARGAVVDSLLIALCDSKEKVRRDAAFALGQIGDPRAVEPLIAALDDPNATVRQNVIFSLGKIGDSRAIEPLIATLRDPHKWVRWWSAKTLGQIGDGRAIEPLITALLDAHEWVRWTAAKALGQIGDTRAVEPLLAALHDRNKVVRRNAAFALGQIGDTRAVKSLILCLHDRNAAMRCRAAVALGKLGDALAVEPLVATLADPKASVRWAAAVALGEIGDPRALPELERMAREDHGRTREERVANAAREAVRKIRRHR